ncbi:MAG: caspase family protein, partial [Lentisphaerae bacterium]|nr:caspase family protein [Lentisphaerota bacterium]
DNDLLKPSKGIPKGQYAAITGMPATDTPSQIPARSERPDTHRTAALPVKSDTSTDKASAWAVIVGIAEYKYAGTGDLTNLIFADDDALSFARTLLNQGWRSSHIKLLVNSEATQRNIMIALESWLTKASSEDLIVLFWSGHGFPDPEDQEKVYFACHDTDVTIPATGYRMDKVRASLEEKKSKNVVVVADTCHAGKILTRGNKGVSIISHVDKLRREDLIPKGWIFMVSADTDRQAIEHSSWSNGAFTKCLLDALAGKADGYESMGARDGIITMNELRAYVRSVMPEETQRVLGVAKHPIITTSTGDPAIWNLSLGFK